MREAEREKCSLVDSHVHLDLLEDLRDALEEARRAGLKGIVGVGMNVESNRKILEISEEHGGEVYPAIGYHPWQIEEGEVEENLSFIRDHLAGCVALGEIGLDYKVKVEREVQQKVFERLLAMALDFGKPVILHCRFSHSQTLRIVKAQGVRRAVFHWYSGPLAVLEEILSAGYLVSATPALSYSPFHQEAIKRAPLDRILLETDAPVAYGERESRPIDVRITLEEVARLKGIDAFHVARQTTLNASQFFGLSFQDLNPWMGREVASTQEG